MNFCRIASLRLFEPIREILRQPKIVGRLEGGILRTETGRRMFDFGGGGMLFPLGHF
jgi:hypothetical protein